MPHKEQLVDSIVRLKRVARRSDDATRDELEPVLARLEQLVGPTLNRSQVARLLGVSHTAVSRWIDKGDVATVLTSRGRREIPTSEAVALRERLGQTASESSLALAREIHRLRVEADELDVSSLLPRHAVERARDRHGRADLISLAYHRAVAARLDRGVVFDARRRLQRWVRERRIDPRWAREWQELLSRPESEIAKVISADNEHTRTLRQSSPFPGVLTEHERRRVLEAIANASR